MRSVLLACSAAALAVLSGCGSSPPPTTDGAWFVTLSPAASEPGMCAYGAELMSSAGVINASEKSMVVDDGANNTSITCSVIAAASGEANAFDVTINGQAMGGDPMVPNASTLGIEILSLKAGATATAPVTGTVDFSSPQTSENSYSSRTCQFYFTPGTMEGVSLGQVWMTFACPTITYGMIGSICELQPSYAIFENCATM
jgi:hypothetical protein